MCARYTMRTSAETLFDLFELDEAEELGATPPIVRPTDLAAVVVAGESGRIGRMMRWGLVPHWASDLKIGVKMINARSETVFEKPAFRESILKRRCLVPADGFFEWTDIVVEETDLFGEPRKGKPRKQPQLITVTDQPVFAFAGMYDRWKDRATGAVVFSYTILTCEPNEVVVPIHDRMPVILRQDRHAAWLDQGLTDPEGIAALMEPVSAAVTRVFAVPSADDPTRLSA